MRKIVLFFFLAFLSYAAALPAHPQGRPIPPGVREADRQANAPMEPPASPKRALADPAQLRGEASELAKLCTAIPAQVEQVNKGQIPKDLREQLKRIEKLAKHLRSEIVP